MRILRLTLNGFKGRKMDIPIHGRDLVVAGNMVGKTAIKEGLDFLATGSVPGLKREDLIDFCSDGRFSVSLAYDRGDGKIICATRDFKVSESGATKMGLSFSPSGLESNQTEAEARLAKDFANTPLVTFDVSEFLHSDDTTRLKTCMDMMPRVEGADVEKEVRAGIFETYDNMIVMENPPKSLREALESVRDEIVRNITEVEGSAMDRYEILSNLLEKWASDERAVKTQKTKAVRELGDLSRLASPVSGINLEAMGEQLKQAQLNLDTLTKAKGAADERRMLIAETRDHMARIQTTKMQYESDLIIMAKAIEDGESALKASEAMLAEMRAAKDEFDKEEAERIAKVQSEIEDKETALRLTRVDREDAVRKVAEADSQLSMLSAQISAAQEGLNALALSRGLLEASSDHCPTCRAQMTPTGKADLIQRMVEEESAYRVSITAKESAKEYWGKEKNRFEVTRSEKDVLIASFEAKLTSLRKKVLPTPFDKTTIGQEKDVQARALALARARENYAVMRANVANVSREYAEKEKLIGDLSVELPEEIENAAIEGARMERDNIARRIEEVKRTRQRFEDQEKLRLELSNAETRLAATMLWKAALGYKGLAGRCLSKLLDRALGPAQALVEKAIPGAVMSISWETPRGKPGMRIQLERNGVRVSQAAMSGAEKAIIGTALILAFSGLKRPPAIVALECEVMNDDTEERYLKALVELVDANTALLVMTHHGLRRPESFWRLDLGELTC